MRSAASLSMWTGAQFKYSCPSAKGFLGNLNSMDPWHCLASRSSSVRPAASNNPPLEQTAATVYFTCGRGSRVLRSGRSTALRYGASVTLQLKTINYRGGVVRFRIPADWAEEYGQDGAG